MTPLFLVNFVSGLKVFPPKWDFLFVQTITSLPEERIEITWPKLSPSQLAKSPYQIFKGKSLLFFSLLFLGL